MGGDALTQCGSCTHALHLGGSDVNITRVLCSRQIGAWGRRIRNVHMGYTWDTQCTWGTSHHPVASPDTPNIWALLALSGAYCSRTLPGALTACSRQWLLVVAVDTEFRIPFPIAGAQEDTRLAIAVDKYGYLVSSTPHS